MPSNMYHAGDPCSCKAFVCNATGDTLTGYPLFVILEVIGSYYFAPSFGPFDSYLDSHPSFETGLTEIIVLDEFEWPDNVGSLDGLKWYGAMTDPAITQLYGELDTIAA